MFTLLRIFQIHPVSLAFCYFKQPLALAIGLSWSWPRAIHPKSPSHQIREPSGATYDRAEGGEGNKGRCGARIQLCMCTRASTNSSSDACMRILGSWPLFVEILQNTILLHLTTEVKEINFTFPNSLFILISLGVTANSFSFFSSGLFSFLS